MENINRGVEDAFYRYKMPKLQSKIEGNGNGIKTVIPNMKEIARSLSRPPEYTTKFFGFELGAQTIMDEKTARYVVNGAHDAHKLAEILDIFIKKFVLCPACGNPETDMVLKNSKVGKDKDVYLSCKACGKVSLADPSHKLCTFINKNPPPGASSSKKGADKKGGKKGGKGSDEDADVKPEDPLEREPSEGMADTTAALARSSLEDPAELFAKFVSGGDRTATELAFEASKHDLPQELAAAVVIQVLMDQTIVAQFKKYKALLKEYISGEKAQKGLIGGLERLVCVTYPELLPKTPQIIKLFYDAEILEEEIILAWYDKPTKKYAGDKELAKKVRDAAQPLIDWLKNAEEESDEE